MDGTTKRRLIRRVLIVCVVASADSWRRADREGRSMSLRSTSDARSRTRPRRPASVSRTPRRRPARCSRRRPRRPRVRFSRTPRRRPVRSSKRRRRPSEACSRAEQAHRGRRAPSRWSRRPPGNRRPTLGRRLSPPADPSAPGRRLTRRRRGHTRRVTRDRPPRRAARDPRRRTRLRSGGTDRDRRRCGDRRSLACPLLDDGSAIWQLAGACARPDARVPLPADPPGDRLRPGAEQDRPEGSQAGARSCGRRPSDLLLIDDRRCGDRAGAGSERFRLARHSYAVPPRLAPRVRDERLHRGHRATGRDQTLVSSSRARHTRDSRSSPRSSAGAARGRRLAGAGLRGAPRWAVPDVDHVSHRRRPESVPGRSSTFTSSPSRCSPRTARR